VHPAGYSSSSSYGFLIYLGFFFVIFKLGGDIYGKTRLKKNAFRILSKPEFSKLLVVPPISKRTF
jgi:hypothetical protein